MSMSLNSESPGPTFCSLGRVARSGTVVHEEGYCGPSFIYCKQLGTEEVACKVKHDLVL
jgi:hypothetical protein